MARIDFVRSLDVNSPDYQRTERELLDLVFALIGKDRTATEELWDRIEAFLTQLVGEHGWTRKGVYELVGNVLTRAYSDPGTAGHIDLPEDIRDQLDNYETGLNGDCAPESIRRFPGEPEGVKALCAYVRGGRWLD